MTTSKRASRTSKTSAPAARKRAKANDDAARSPFGEKLRAIREARDISIKELAAAAGVSVGILSQVERGINSPSLNTVAKLRGALGLPISAFFEEEHPAGAQADTPQHICRREERGHLKLGGAGTISKELLHRTGARVFEMMIINLPAGSATGKSSYPSEKGGMVLDGEVTLTIGGKSSKLRPGDSFLFDGIEPHNLKNPHAEPARVLWIVAKLPNELML
jgi:transcriptional regulator with XRE-family HTH domain